ncbi:von Willebrand factor type A domain-containing protein [Escherichia albertii]|uniref:vWA domain-containing protein n=1 Tax=Escherichia albertii TaxID=208962 RepID=UPI00074393EE|nr:VWA domain-containing protein [Escherichia albertii]EAB1452324.1 VWA domain-containing protein [Escherichia albertii]EEW3328940.1 VWA domain-containing protein [Escherichia albertii]EEW7340047.1 VWA domain-containing protein [Escherichia albertii]EJY9798128.1 VWA domain-containing protein [Escherichia albertii]MCQ8935112.1 VWA domain-containing protein [Escherichia albertii]
MRNKNIIMLLIGGLILTGCGQEPDDQENQQQQSSTSTDQQAYAAQQAATKVAEQRASEAKAAADAKTKVLAETTQNETQQYTDQQALQGQLQAAPAYESVAKAKATRISNPGTARYQQFDDNPVKQVAQNPLATFSLDVDTGSYANVRRFLNQGQLPPPDAVRVEEMVNYFPSDWVINDKQSIPASKPIPFAMRYELAPAPWNEQRTLLKVDILAQDLKSEALPASNLVFLIDTSGSMYSDERLPLIQSSLKLLVKELREQDNISIVTYAGDSRIALPSTSGNHKDEINAAIDSLNARGSTNGGAGLEMAYQQAAKGFIKGGVNRILLATDGDFNVGIDDPKSIESMVKKQRESGVTLSTLGVGRDNYNEAMMVRIADVGNGNYSYIDTLSEAQKVLNSEMHQTLVTVAKDVKAQIEFNPAWVTEYRQIGYEKRQLQAEDFNNDNVDAGDIGAGKHITLLFELTLNGQKAAVDKLRYTSEKTPIKSGKEKELAWLKLRWKSPQGKESQLAEFPLAPTINIASEDMLFRAAVAAYGQKLRGSEYLNDTSWQQIKQWAQQAKGQDPQGYRAEFIRLVGLAEGLMDSRR